MQLQETRGICVCEEAVQVWRTGRRWSSSQHSVSTVQHKQMRQLAAIIYYQ